MKGQFQTSPLKLYRSKLSIFWSENSNPLFSFFFYILQEFSKSELFFTLFLLFQRVDEKLIHKNILCIFVFTKLKIVILKNVNEILLKWKIFDNIAYNVFCFNLKERKGKLLLKLLSKRLIRASYCRWSRTRPVESTPCKIFLDLQTIFYFHIVGDVDYEGEPWPVTDEEGYYQSYKDNGSAWVNWWHRSDFSIKMTELTDSDLRQIETKVIPEQNLFFFNWEGI